MPTDVFAERVLAALQARRILSTFEADHAKSLTRSGLTLEQSTVGTGLLPVDVYDEQLGFAAGLPVVRSPETIDGVLDEDLLERHQALPFAKHKCTVLVAFARPLQRHISAIREALFQMDLSCMPYVAPESSFWRKGASLPSAHQLLNRLSERAAHSRSRHIRLIHESSSIRAVADSGHQLVNINLSHAHIPAIAYRVKRLGKSSGWLAEILHKGLGTALHLTRVGDGQDCHPTCWSALETAHMNRPEALTVIFARDPSYIRETFSRGNQGEVFPADSEDEQELALHAALSGKPVTAWTSDDSNWWKPVLEAGLRVRVLKAEPTPHGWAWSSYLERT